MIRKCARCEQEKPVSEFWKDNTKSGDGYRKQCKVCSKERRGTRKPPALERPDETLSKAKQMALKQLVENHRREFQVLFNRYYASLGAQERWRAVG